ncbi:sensor histidine kinase [Anaerobacillus arseniciselenatis]|uniref:sensor histidine kinase n=1 Tax=Anaerobacillus arseniciselenatis TaxID=85682 RepID=UPI000AB41F72|nr:ATP-binding protein [Anaerobacillus arseniciselenatis]
MKRRLSQKITIFVLLILLLIISTMVLFSYHFFKNFYKEHLSHEVYEELRAYTSMIENGYDEEVISYFIIEKNRERHAHLVYFSPDFELIYSSHPISDQWLSQYEEWVKYQYQTGGETLEYVDTGIDFHIPHIWAYQPIYKEGQLTGLFFIDKDTGEFEKAKMQLFFLLFSMGLFAFIIGIALTLYLTKVISMPLIKMGETTREIAKGDFDTKLTVYGEDEVGQLAEDIRVMTKQLKDFRDSKRQFISHISHDLRTPITYIKGYSAVMKDAPTVDDKEWRRNLDVIYNEAKRMEYLVSDLFQLTKLEEGKIILHKEKVNVLPWLEAIVATRQLMLDNLSIHCEAISTNNEITVCIDQQRLGQAVINILENSIRYTPKGGSIKIVVVEKETDVIIEISDTGVGIGKEDLPYIFERFYRVDKSRSRESGGSGLGLAIVKEIVEVHNGSVDVKSEEGKGTSFYIKIPKGE